MLQCRLYLFETQTILQRIVRWRKDTDQQADGESDGSLRPDESTAAVSIDGSVDDLSCAVDVTTTNPGSCHCEYTYKL